MPHVSEVETKPTVWMWFSQLGHRYICCDWRVMLKPRRIFTGGSQGNEHLTAVVAAVLLLMLFVEGATLLRIGSLLTVHAFVGGGGGDAPQDRVVA